MQNIVAIVQARLSSTRLPGKILKPLAGKPVLQHVLERLQQSKKINKIVVATTLESDDDALVEWCRNKQVEYFRGDLENVLSRFYLCATQFGAETIVRVTSDNPLVDAKIVDQTIDLFFQEKADYAANNMKKTFPHGLDVEVVSYAALKEAHLEAKEKFEKEHVTQFIRRRPQRYKLANLAADGNFHDIRVTLDEDEDLQLIEIVLRLLGNNNGFDALKKLFEQLPALKNINAASRERHANYNRRESII